ncbi:GNAT family N-acetyltransferase [Desulfosporosinus hippei]|uniref:Acetyltransferase (GNAT) domain-containing protein n=1 Tax=Desulfosporosinus hippei DSM 8344 TaxID=1121419 RepID=A0A1G8CSB7_9FIRM|nr:GNAT family N-acetyltransferase [Desulfosporosinus hippei]SDH48234.1 Acetyltransferase (GNAT) domain-containing protein [Desulfosporosinus hippei DSM 8344]
MTLEKISINEIMDEASLVCSLNVIKDSFTTVAREFKLTEENCPSNPAFINLENLMTMKNKGIAMFGLFEKNNQIGFVAVEKADDSCYLERLAVLPDYRHKGYGKLLMDFVFNYAKAQGAKKVSIGIIDENSVLKDWYEIYGFRETGLKKYEHLPFTVCFMEKAVESK